MEIADGTLEGEEIEVAVQGQGTGRKGGSLGMRSENLEVCKREATREKDPEPRRWDKLVSVTKMVFRERHIPTALTWTTMMQITNGGGECIGTGLVEIIQKVCASIMNNRLRAVISLHDVLQGLRQGRGTATEAMKSGPTA